MALAPRIEIRQSQSLAMTPQLMQAIKLLQMSNIDLNTYVNEELERNPLLERSDETGDGGIGTNPEEGADNAAQNRLDDHDASTNSVGGDANVAEADGSFAVSAEADWMETDVGGDKSLGDSVDADANDIFPEEYAAAQAAEAADNRLDVQRLAGGDSWSGSAGPAAAAGDFMDLEKTATKDITLFDHLADQLALLRLSPELRAIASVLILSLDETGYLREPVDAISARLGVEEVAVLGALSAVQSLEPAGVGARSLSECLGLQLKDRNRFDPAMAVLLQHLELLARGELSKLCSLCGVDQDDLIDMISEVRALDPKPGQAFSGAPVQTVVPDVMVKPRSDGGWSVELNSETLPKVLLDRSYYATVQKSAKAQEERAFLTECAQSANWLIKSLDQRATTILKVSTEIVRQQDAFLTYGVAHLRPLTLKAVADVIGMHESTVSRVTANKYMATTRGIFELKYFFTASIASADGGEAHSAEAVRFRIKQLIDAENPKKILSDDTLVRLLKEQGIDVARRTVAKYREAMRIPSSVQRRREKKALA